MEEQLAENPDQTQQEMTSLTPEQTAEVAEGIASLVAFAEQQPEELEAVHDLVGEFAAQPIDADSGSRLYKGLSLYMAEDAASFLIGILAAYDDPLYVEEVRSRASSDVWRWLRRLMAIHGARVQEIYRLSNENPEAWRDIIRRVHYDAISETWSIDLEILKYSGERLRLHETPFTALWLAMALVDTLGALPPGVGPEVVVPERVQEFFVRTMEVAEALAPGLLDNLAASWDEEDEAEGPVELEAREGQDGE